MLQCMVQWFITFSFSPNYQGVCGLFTLEGALRLNRQVLVNNNYKNSLEILERFKCSGLKSKVLENDLNLFPQYCSH